MGASLADFTRASDAVDRLISVIGTDQWEAPTPCTQWCVRHVVEHLVTGNRIFAVRLRGAKESHHTGSDSDPVSAYRASVAALHTAIARPGVLQQAYPGQLGEATVAEYLQLRLADLLTHGWDLAHATGQLPDLPDDLVERALTYLQNRIEGLAASGQFADSQSVDGAAPAIDRLAALAGRTVPPR